MTNKKLSPLLIWLLFIILAIIWGSSFILMKKGLAAFSYGQIGMIRISLAFLFTAIIAFKKFKLLTKENWFPLMIVGVFGNGIPYLLFPLAVTKLDSSLVGILNSVVPLFTLIIGIIWFRLKIKWPSIVGLTLGFMGTFWLLVPGMKIEADKLLYGMYPIIATVCYAISINTINSKLKDLDALSITLLSLFFVGVPAIGYTLFTDFFTVMGTHPQAWESLIYVAILGIVGSSLAIIGFNYLIKETSSLFAASVTYAIPIIALVWGVVDGEAIGIEHLGGMLLILIGVYMVNQRGNLADRIKKKKAARKPL